MNLKSLKIRREVVVGFFFLIALSILIWGILYLKGMEIFKERRTVYAVYERVNGLVPSNPVTINGLKIGQVKEVYFSPKNPRQIIAVLFLHDSKYPIPKNSVAKIVSSDLLGSKEVAIELGDSRELLKSGDTLNSLTEATLTEEVNAQLMPLKKKAENLISSIDTLATVMNEVLNANTRANLVEAIGHIKEALMNLAHTTYNIDTLVESERGNLSRIITNVESISSNLKKNNGQVTNILTNFSSISDSIAKLKIPATFGELDQTLRNLNEVIEKINKGNGSLGMLVNDQKLYLELEKSARDLNLLLEDIKANPKKYVKVSVF
jgi:phospholipid/cholesterol/gamma-HCH transport system substrate-binding protein